MSDLMQQAEEAKASGDIPQAKRLLSMALVQNPMNETAWLQMADLVEDVSQRRSCLQRALAINPKNTEANLALSKLDTSPLAPITRGERNKPLDPPSTEKTPPFTWEGDQEDYLPAEGAPSSEPAAELAEKPAEEAPTFDWAHETDEPDKTIDKLFTAVSSPETAYQPQGETDLSWINHSAENSAPKETPPAEETQDALLDELVGDVPETPVFPEMHSDKPASWKVTKSEVNAEVTSTQNTESIAPEYRLWDNPKAPQDRLVILGNKSIIIAHPKASDIPHIQGLFAEHKMLRDLLGENTTMIWLDSIQTIQANLKTRRVKVTFLQDKKTPTHKLVFETRKTLDEFIEALEERLPPGFTRNVHTISLADKVVPPLAILLLVGFLEWAVTTGLPLLSSVPGASLGQMQPIVAALQGFVTLAGASTLEVFLAACGLLCLVWLVNNLIKPSQVLTLDHRPKKPGKGK